MLNNLIKLKNFIGIAQKAGKIKSGDAAVLEAVSRNTVKLIIIAEDTADSVKAELNRNNTFNIPCIVFADKITLGEITGKSPRGMLGVTDAGFAAAIKEKYDALF